VPCVHISGPKEKYFTRFQEWFNYLTEEKQKINDEAITKIQLLSPEDEVTRNFKSTNKSLL